MTDKVNPSVNRPAEAFITAGAIAYGGGSRDGYVVESQNTTEMSIQSPDINESSLNEFSQTNSGLDVSISGGEAFVFGAWLAIDEVTVVTLPPSSTSTIYLGWNRKGSDDVIIGLESAFNDASGAADQKIPLFTFDTDATVVTSVTDERSFDQIATSSIEQGSGGLIIHGKTLESGETVTLSDDEGAVVSEDYTVNGILNIEEGGSITVI